MFCCSKKHSYKIHPEKPKIKKSTIIDDQLTSSQFTEQFIGEVLSCGTCNKAFSLRENENDLNTSHLNQQNSTDVTH